MKLPMNRQNGIALISALLILILLSAIAVGLVLTSNTESSVNANYRKERELDFAARAGIEEVRDRMAPASANTLISPTCASASACLAATPVVPSTSNNGILYVRGGKTPASVTPWTANTVYTDDELCHDGYGLVTAQSSDVHCSAVPTGSAWYATTNSTAPWAGTGAALPFQWVRVSWKLNGSVQGYPVNVTSCSLTGVGAGCSTPVCWDGAEEILLPAGDTNCGQAASRNPAGSVATAVYLMTSMALNTTTGARKMVQAEVALPPPTVTNLAGFFATSTACGAFVMQGGATTDGFSSTSGGYPASRSTTAGGIGSNGSVSLGGSPTQVGGNVYVPNALIGACPDGVQESGGAGLLAGNNVIAQPAVTVATPPAPNPVPPTTNLNNPTSLVPGQYGNINLTGHTALTLSPGIYNINSISMTGQATVTISPAGAVVINVAGTGQATPVDLEGGGLMNTTGVAGNFQVNYAGTGNVKVAGGSGSYAVINSPNASLQFTGGSNFYGSAVGATVSDTGGTALHFDTTLMNHTTTPAANLAEISLREVSY
jgi:Tfp pilus assembly protein PilX